MLYLELLRAVLIAISLWKIRKIKDSKFVLNYDKEFNTYLVSFDSGRKNPKDFFLNETVYKTVVIHVYERCIYHSTIDFN